MNRLHRNSPVPGEPAEATPWFDIAPAAVAAFCRKWRIAELALFGSVLRPDFTPASDVDVLVTFEPEARWSLFDFIAMRDELRDLVRREVDLVSEGGLRNPFRRHEILTTRRILYAA